MSKILVVDDEEPIVDAISYNLKKQGFLPARRDMITIAPGLSDQTRMH